jgi:hypothetical protein
MSFIGLTTAITSHTAPVPIRWTLFQTESWCMSDDLPIRFQNIRTDCFDIFHRYPLLLIKKTTSTSTTLSMAQTNDAKCPSIEDSATMDMSLAAAGKRSFVNKKVIRTTAIAVVSAAAVRSVCTLIR